jgi:hypothetical protein
MRIQIEREDDEFRADALPEDNEFNSKPIRSATGQNKLAAIGALFNGEMFFDDATALGELIARNATLLGLRLEDLAEDEGEPLPEQTDEHSTPEHATRRSEDE